MTRQTDGNTIETVMELLIENGFDGLADCMRILLNEAMKIERNHALGAGPYERSDARKGHANGYKPKTVDTRLGRLTVFELPESHQKRTRTTNMLERLHEEINRRTRVARLFPNPASLLRLVSAIEMEISEDWIAGKRYLTMNAEKENVDPTVNSNKKRIYRKTVA
jgi:transposase-like protein